MKLILRFLKPHWKTCLLTIVLMIVDVAGALFIPTLVADMLNQGTSGASFSAVVHTGIQMAVVSVLAGVCAVWGGYTCASLSARVGKDMREAIYAKSLKLSVYDFRQFGTASITTRTISDITTIQFALISTIQMVIPVPVICVLALVMTFGLDAQMGLILLAVVAVVLLLAYCIMRSASPLFRRLQKLLDRMSTVLLENITGVRVVRAFNNEDREVGRMTSAFSDHAGTHQPAHAVLRGERRQDHRGRGAHRRHDPLRPAPQLRHGPPGYLALRRHRGGEHRLRQAGGHPGGDRGRGQGGEGGLLHPHHAPGL